MSNDLFSPDFVSTKPHIVYPRASVTDYGVKMEAEVALNAEPRAKAFAEEINHNRYADFEKEGVDRMCHVSTFLVKSGHVYVSYYANTQSDEENPDFQVARLAYCPLDNPADKTIVDIQAAGDTLCGHTVNSVYDTIIMEKPDEPDTIYVLWTAKVDGRYYRLYRTFDCKTGTLGAVDVNRFQVGEIVNDFSFSGMQNALAENGIGYKEFFADIGIMQKQSWREENGKPYCYTGAYSGGFTCIIKSCDLITWEYVAQPNEGANGTGFANETIWENAVYVKMDKVYYFVRQFNPTYAEDGALKSGSPYGILTYYDLLTGQWAKPILVGDCQSRADFIAYQGGLYVIYAPTDREHLGILKIDTEDFYNTSVVLQANMQGSCFYPFLQYFQDGELAISYTVERRHIRLAPFTLSKYL